MITVRTLLGALGDVNDSWCVGTGAGGGGCNNVLGPSGGPGDEGSSGYAPPFVPVMPGNTVGSGKRSSSGVSASGDEGDDTSMGSSAPWIFGAVIIGVVGLMLYGVTSGRVSRRRA